MVIVAKSLFYEGKKYYPQVFLDKCLNKLYMLEYVRIDMSEGIDIILILYILIYILLVTKMMIIKLNHYTSWFQKLALLEKVMLVKLNG